MERESATKGSDMEKIESLTAQAENLLALLESERQRTEECEKKYVEAHEKIEIMRSEETEKKALLKSERQRADKSKKRYVEALETIKKMKLEETERKTELEDRSLVKERESTLNKSSVSLGNGEKHFKTELEDGSLTKENKYASDVSDVATSLGEKVPVFLEAEKIDNLISELEKLKALLESERQRADAFEKKFSEALRTIKIMHAKLNETERRVLQLQEEENREPKSGKEASDRDLSVVKDSEDTGKIESLTAEVKNLKVLLELERQRADKSETKFAEALELINIMHLNLEGTERKAELEDRILGKEHEYPIGASVEASSIRKKATASVEDTGKTQSSSAEVENLKALVESERQRANECEKKYTEALESNEIKRQKFEETERRVLQLQDALNSVPQDDIQHVRPIFRAKNYDMCFIQFECNFRVRC